MTHSFSEPPRTARHPTLKWRWGGLLVLPAVVVAVLLVGRSTGGPDLGPVDGADLPATDLDRVQAGDVAPDFSLRTRSGDIITLSDYRGGQNVVLVFYRGHW